MLRTKADDCRFLCVQRAHLLLDIIASLPQEEHTLGNFPCWLHMLTSRGKGSTLMDTSETPASVVRTVQKHTADEADRILSAVSSCVADSFGKVDSHVENLSAKLDTVAKDQAFLKNQLRELDVRLRGIEKRVPASKSE